MYMVCEELMTSPAKSWVPFPSEVEKYCPFVSGCKVGKSSSQRNISSNSSTGAIVLMVILIATLSVQLGSVVISGA